MTMTDTQTRILNVVHGLEHAKDRLCVNTGQPIAITGFGIPRSVIRAEIRCWNGGASPDQVFDAELDELVVREYLTTSSVTFEHWPTNLNYRLPCGSAITTRKDEGSGCHEVLVDGTCVAIEEVDAEFPGKLVVKSPDNGGYAAYEAYCITPLGLASIVQAQPEPVVERAPGRWKPPTGYVGAKTITSDERFWKGGKRPPRTTIDTWVNRDKKHAKAQGRDPVTIVKAPDSGENFYPEDWVQEQIRLWHPRAK